MERPAFNPVADPLFGTGVDGTVTISSGTTLLTRDTCYQNLTISGTGQIATNGFRIYVSGTLDISAAPTAAIIGSKTNSVNSTGATPGAAWYGTGQTGYTSTGNICSSVQNGGGLGGTGGTGVGGAGTANLGITGGIVLGGSGGSGGVGGASTSAAGAVGATAAIGTNGFQYFPMPPKMFNIFSNYYGTICYGVCSQGGSGGSAGGGDGTNAGGAGGTASGVSMPIAIFAKNIQRGNNTTASIIQSRSTVGINGGNGGNGAGGNAGGGGGAGGAGGGFVYILVQNLLGETIPNCIDVSGQNGGTGGNGVGTGKGGTGGTGGAAGGVQILNLGRSSFTYNTPNGGLSTGLNTAGTNSTAATTATTTAGTAGGAGAVLTVNL